jgi:RNA polymerase-associated protein
MLTLYDNPFSPFARKVRLALDHKGLAFESIDALAIEQHEKLLAVNPRAEVPVLVDDDLTIADSSDIVAYLEDGYPEPPVFPQEPKLRATARAWERLSDTLLDAIIHDISIWSWPTHRRQDHPPQGLIDAGRRDLWRILEKIETTLEGSGFLCGGLSIADLAVFPHLSSLKALGIVFDPSRHPGLCDWNRRMRTLGIVRRDLEYVKRIAIEKFIQAPSPYEGEKIVWRGDRIEWLLHNGFQRWWLEEHTAGRAVVPASI